jgi:hypothetical protein
LSYINSGGGLITSEWTTWGNADHGFMATLAPAFPVTPSTTFDSNSTLKYTQSTPDPVLDAGLPSSFFFLPTMTAEQKHNLSPKPEQPSFLPAPAAFQVMD